MTGKCEVCGEPSTCEVVDANELEPSPPDEKGNRYQRLEVRGEAHHFCQMHERDGATFHLDGTITVAVRYPNWVRQDVLVGRWK